MLLLKLLFFTFSTFNLVQLLYKSIIDFLTSKFFPCFQRYQTTLLCTWQATDKYAVSRPAVISPRSALQSRRGARVWRHSLRYFTHLVYQAIWLWFFVDLITTRLGMGTWLDRQNLLKDRTKGLDEVEMHLWKRDRALYGVARHLTLRGDDRPSKSSVLTIYLFSYYHHQPWIN